MPQPTWAAETRRGGKAAGPRLGSPLSAGPPVPDPGKLEPQRTSQEGRPWCCCRGKETRWLLPHLSPAALPPGVFSYFLEGPAGRDCEQMPGSVPENRRTLLMLGFHPREIQTSSHVGVTADTRVWNQSVTICHFDESSESSNIEAEKHL